MRPLVYLLMLLSETCHLRAVVGTSGIFQDSGLIRANVGQNVTLRCSCQNNGITFLSWYQQSLGGKPTIISTRMKHSEQADIYSAFKERFQVFAKSQENTNDLTITDVGLSDSGTYYCGILEFNSIEFGKGVFLHVKTSLSKTQTVVHQPAVVPHRLGEAVRLSCTVHTEQCEGDESLLWFRHGGSQPAIMLPSEKRCTSPTEEQPPMKTCNLTLTIKSPSSPDSGMYYCALASCGEIVFGNGTRLEIVHVGGSTKPSALVYCLSAALAVSIMVLLALVFIMYKLKRKLCSVCKGSASHVTCAAASDALSHVEDSLHYAALSLNRISERRQENSTDSVCVYSRVKSRRGEVGHIQLLQ